MSDPTATELCRLVIRAPSRSFEIAAPSDVPIAELLPTFVLYAEGDEGEDLDESGLEHDGWVLQQLGDDPIDEDETIRSLGLCHGETLYLRPRRDQLPPIHFDDLVDGVASGMAERPDRWRPAFTRMLLQGLGLGVLLLGLPVLLLGGTGGLTALIGASSAVLMLLAAWAASRAMGDPLAATGLAGAAILYMVLAGAAMPAGEPGTSLLGARILAGSMAGAGATVLGLAAVAGSIPFFLGTLVVQVFGVLYAVCLMFLPSATIAGCAGLVGMLSLLLSTFAPQLAFRISGMRLPPLPANPKQLQEAIDPYPARDVLDRTRLADGYQSALLASTGAVLACCLVLLARTPGWVPITLCVVFALVMLLQTRGLASAWQRMYMVVPPCLGLTTLLLFSVWDADVLARLLTLLGLFAVATSLALVSWTLPGRRPLPHWGRAAEIIQILLAVALLSLVLANLGVFTALRGIGG
ncbi:type VII secretion integral membrane protein EccD [Marinitenerispora sediminis]|uniref:Type VII secretion integral membrane protein EccD n=1 Tax=Marinitenerispora sediminis TaxID=1931232 RepID=A0A368T2R6_9ACTN|nr:type VII secretion integral membrane protein EccD [Marinitenerispora sediminis]RCV49276.1 type VII secretion integral membrane protein EccD [Marinitenerispora sediminis]RCV56186.1 type VII secretion integral membrane protein EccD [Marinitenerispora sediminis]RCV57475.1 type VII secretion integral membrane protein EccD [Marinitenerispora sediminis]